MADFLFDIGKVLLDFDFESSLAKLLPPDHPDPAAVLGKLLERKDELETGRIAVDDFIAWATGIIGTNATPDEFLAAWRNIFTPNEPMWDAVRRLAADAHRLILFSNTSAIHCPWVFEAYPDFSHFHGSILSFEADSMKPDPGIYQHAIDKYSLIPENTLYIDDLAANIETGNRFGLRTHQYDLNNHQAFEQWLSEQLTPDT